MMRCWRQPLATLAAICCVVLHTGVVACPSDYMACEAWTADSSFPSKAMYGVSAVTNATESQCRIRGLPQTYFGDETYTIAVVSDNIVARKLFASQGAITASSRSGPRPSVEEGEPSPLCYNCDRPVYGAVLFDWTAPAVGSGDVTFAALCGGSSIGLGGSGFVAATPHVVTTPAREGYPDAGHRVDTSALEEFILAGRTASAHGSHDSHASSSSSHAAMGGHGMVFAAFSPLHPSLTILFKGWDVTTSPQYAGAIICFFVLGVLVRLLRILLGSIRRRASRHSFVSQTGIFFIINTLAYALMLAAMTCVQSACTGFSGLRSLRAPLPDSTLGTLPRQPLPPGCRLTAHGQPPAPQLTRPAPRFKDTTSAYFSRLCLG